MPHLLFTVTTDLTYDQRMQRICSTMATAGYNVTLVGREKPDSKPLQHTSFKQIRLKCRFNKGKLFYFEYNYRLFFYLLKYNADLICAIDLDTLLPGFLISKIKNLPLVYDSHEYFTEVIEITDRPAIKKMWLTLEQLVVPKLNYAYTVTQTIAAAYEAKYNTRFEVIRNCSILKPTTPQIESKKEDHYFIYQGAVNAGRGLAETIQAMQFVPAKLIICGDGDLLNELKELVEKLHLQDKVIFKGYVLPADLQTFTQQAFAGINLLENKGLSYYYSLANKFFDYVHAYIPQLCAPFPEYNRLNTEHEVAILCGLNVKEIATALNTLLTNNAVYKMLSDNCAKARLEWNWQAEEKKLIQFYNQILPVSA